MGEKVRVKNPNGEFGYIPKEQLQSALSKGYSVANDSMASNSFEPPMASGSPARNPSMQGPNLAAEDILPTAGGVVGAMAGAPLGPLGVGAGAASFGLAGQSAKNLIRAARGKSVPATPIESVKESGMEGIKQGGAALVGESIAAGIGPIVRGAGRLVGKASGLLTGTGGAVEQAARAGLEGGTSPKALINTMRGDVSEKQVVSDALDSLQIIRRNRSKEYTKALDEINAKSFQKKIDLTPIKTELDDLLYSYNISRSKKGKLDFSRAALDDPSANDVKRIANLVDEWGTKPGDKTVKGLDILKRRIDDFFSPSSEARAFVSSLRNKVKSTIVNSVPEYGKLTSKYQVASDAIHDISSELSLGANAKAGTVIRKLQQALRPNFGLRKEFIATLDSAGKKDLMSQVAGIELSGVLPKGLMRAVAGGTGAVAPFTNPLMLAGLPFTSPRLAGEAALKVGQAARFVSPLKRGIRPAFQVGVGVRRELMPDEINQE